jgi:hypothetical protein
MIRITELIKRAINLEARSIEVLDAYLFAK